MSGALLKSRTDYLNALRSVPALGNDRVFSHGGAFTPAELERYARAAPAAALTLLKFEPEIEAGIVQAIAHWGVILFTKSTSDALDRSASVIELSELCSIALLYAFSGNAGGRPMGMACTNVYSSPLDDEGIAMWRCEWSQQLDLVQDIGDSVNDWLLAHVDYDLFPRPDGEDLGEVLEASDDIEIPQ